VLHSANLPSELNIHMNMNVKLYITLALRYGFKTVSVYSDVWCMLKHKLINHNDISCIVHYGETMEKIKLHVSK